MENLLDKSWFFRYPRPTIVTHDHRNEFLGHTFKNYLIENKYRIKAKCATTENLQANSILETSINS